MPAPLVHKFPQCTGRWELETAAVRLYWICTGCGAVGSDTTENLEAAVLENGISVQLQQLTREGRKLLDSSGPTW